ncbi:hypothetical protein Y032_0068g160 [Ancylostoma ceylanicum]|uniref:Saposin B-type domain-containing protein n=1 Tax=Ancylostoma ceylanicum TaxID=53326 RepID=A0A016TYD0_9BILA|nr:hypothetical protein Y032_0068g160 [Ancylostoma ceylanicum]
MGQSAVEQLDGVNDIWKVETTSTTCESCVLLLQNVKDSMPAVIKFTEEMLHDVIMNVCSSTPQALREICERFETRVVHELFMWIVKMEQRIQPGRECTFPHFCTTLTTKPSTTTEAQPSTTTGHGFLPFF